MEQKKDIRYIYHLNNKKLYKDQYSENEIEQSENQRHFNPSNYNVFFL